jgi:hypothetical protein
MALAYGADGSARVVYVSNSSGFTLATRTANVWTKTKTPTASAPSLVALSLVGGTPRVAAVARDSTTSLYDVDATGALTLEATTLSGTTAANVYAVRSAVDGSGGYHLLALVRSGDALLLKHLAPGHADWDVTTVSPDHFDKADVTLAGDGSVEVVWNDDAGVLWHYNDSAAVAAKVSETLGTTNGLAVLAKSAAQGPTVLFASTSAWQLWQSGESGAPTTVLKGGAYGDPSLIQVAPDRLLGTVYEPQGAVGSGAFLVASNAGVWTTVTSASDATDAVVATRAPGQASMLVHREYPSPKDSDITLVECE